jgi:hypothetical protein
VVAGKLPASSSHDLLPIIIGPREGEREEKKKKEKEEHCKLKIAKGKVQNAKSAAPFTKRKMIELDELEVFQFEILYQFSFLKWELINPFRPPFFKGRRAFLKAVDKRFLFSPFEKGGRREI